MKVLALIGAMMIVAVAGFAYVSGEMSGPVITSYEPAPSSTRSMVVTPKPGPTPSVIPTPPPLPVGSVPSAPPTERRGR